MTNKNGHLREFGKFRLDAEKRVLWCGDQPVNLALKEIEMLCVLTENGGGEVVTRNEMLERVWQNSFVEESNLSRHIYVLRKTFKDFGETGELIQTVPRRGYRFAGEVRETKNGGSEIIIERHAVSRTLIEYVSDETEIETREHPNAKITEITAVFSPEQKPFVLPASVPAKAARGRLTFALLVFLAVSTVGSIWYFRGNPAATVKKPIKTMAILPLQSLNKDDDDEAFGLGIIESLAARLGNLERLVVRPTGSVKQISKSETDPLEIGRKSKADAVLTGSFQRAAGRIRVTIRLLNVADGSQIWAGNFNENETDIFKLQDSLAAQAADSLVDKLSSDERRQLASRLTEDVEAYQPYLRGRFAWNKRTPEGFADSIRFYQAAIDRDPNFAHAFAGLADSYSMLADFYGLAPHEAYPKAKAAAVRALEINENLAEAHTPLAWILQTYEWNWDGAEREYRRAITLNPNYATAHQWYAEFLMATGRHEEALAEIGCANAPDPSSMIINAVEGWVLFHARDHDRAIEQYRKTAELDPNTPLLGWYVGKIYEQKEDYENAIAANEQSIARSDGSGAAEQSALRKAYINAGVEGYWREKLELLKTQARIKPVEFYEMAEIYVRLGDREKAFALLEKSLQQREYSIINLKVSPALDNLRAAPRYREPLRKMNLQ